MRRWAAAGMVLVVLAGSAACSSDKAKPVRPPEVGLTGKVPDGLRIGLMVTLSSAPGEGADWATAASGAQVATYQYQLGGSKVVLDVVDDQGTAAGAEAAVRTLVSRKVGGVVAASSGKHLNAALQVAAGQHTAVLLPYRTDEGGLPANAWLTGSSAEQQAAVMAKIIDGNNWGRVIEVTGPGRSAVDVGQTDTVALTDRPDPVLRAIRPQRDGRVTADAVVVDGSAEFQGKIAAAIQGVAPDLPIVLSRDALSSRFATALQEAGGALSADLVAVGPDAGDLSAVSAAKQADQAARFFQALRLVAGDPKATDLFGQAAFDGQDADLLSHDAVIALAAAAIDAKSANAPAVLTALEKLHVGAKSGIAGPALDFSGRVAVAAEDVVPLQGTPQDPGLRPAVPESSGAAAASVRLSWFAVPLATAGSTPGKG